MGTSRGDQLLPSSLTSTHPPAASRVIPEARPTFAPPTPRWDSPLPAHLRQGAPSNPNALPKCLPTRIPSGPHCWDVVPQPLLLGCCGSQGVEICPGALRTPGKGRQYSASSPSRPDLRGSLRLTWAPPQHPPALWGPRTSSVSVDRVPDLQPRPTQRRVRHTAWLQEPTGRPHTGGRCTWEAALCSEPHLWQSAAPAPLVCPGGRSQRDTWTGLGSWGLGDSLNKPAMARTSHCPLLQGSKPGASIRGKWRPVSPPPRSLPCPLSPKDPYTHRPQGLWKYLRWDT